MVVVKNSERFFSTSNFLLRPKHSTSTVATSSYLYIDSFRSSIFAHLPQHADGWHNCCGSPRNWMDVHLQRCGRYLFAIGARRSWPFEQYQHAYHVTPTYLSSELGSNTSAAVERASNLDVAARSEWAWHIISFWPRTRPAPSWNE